RDLDNAEARVLKLLGKNHARLIDAHRLILRDTLITHDVPKRILSEGVNAEFALSEALEAVNQQFEKLEDEFFRERRHDLFDVGKRLLAHLLKRTRRSLGDIDQPCVLIARNLLPSDTINLKESRILGFATDLGGKTSHTAILAQSLEIPAVVGLSDVSRRIRGGDTVILDGEQGLVIIGPTPEAVVKYEKVKTAESQAERALEALRGLPAVTLDEKRFRLEVNLDNPEEVKSVLALQSDGIGLFRTEYLFMNRPAAPPEEEQAKAYGAVAKAMFPHSVVIRTADIGGDRLTQMGLEGPQNETNPFMGLRGVRLFLRHLDLFKTQLRAILRATAKGDVKIMIPMVSAVSEVLAVRRLLNQSVTELQAEGVALPKAVELGIMVEIPAAAVMLDAFMPHCDFVSIGTNDLIQYTLAVDRVNENVSHLYDPFHPAVLRLIQNVVTAAHRAGKWVGVCGEMTSDPHAVPLLVGLGCDSLSISPRMYLRVKETVRGLRAVTMAKLVAKAVACSDSEEIRRLMREQGL
ncbi:MAG: phosphoenolpyruvate--protein phosphotransferase, partial [Elusimicrobia bacterium]|nr:phosphoenolpyruvate--protein phosphotransferase [Elusimicrobiota bacterium]